MAKAHLVKRSGFSLIELLVVVVMIGIVTAVGFGNVSKAQERAENTRMEAVTDTVRVALENYRGDFETYPQDLFPAAGSSSGNGFLLDTSSNPRLVQYIPSHTLPKNPWSTFEQRNSLGIAGTSLTTAANALSGADGVKSCIGMKTGTTGVRATTNTYSATTFGAVLYAQQDRTCYVLYGIGRTGGAPSVVSAESNGRQR